MQATGEAQVHLAASSHPGKRGSLGAITVIAPNTAKPDPSAFAKEDQLLWRVSEVDTKLDDVLSLLETCLEGIGALKERPATSANHSHLLRSDTRHSTLQTSRLGNETPLGSRSLQYAWGPGAARPGDREEARSGPGFSANGEEARSGPGISAMGEEARSGPREEAGKRGLGDPWAQPAPLDASGSVPEVGEALSSPAMSPRRFSSTSMFSTDTDTDTREGTPMSRMAGVGFFDDARRSPVVESIWTFLNDSESSLWAWRWERFWCSVVLVSVMIALLQVIHATSFHGVGPAVVETIIEIAFGVELLLRFYTCPDRKAFAKSALNVIDFASVCPLLLRAACGFVLPETLVAPPTSFNSDVVHLILLCFVPVLRLLKILRRNRVQLELFKTVLTSTMETLGFLAFLGLLVIVTSSSTLYSVETRDNVETYGMAVWITIVTMTTVGYGDVTTVTTAGRCVTIVLILCSVLFMALPIGVLGNAFAAVWKDRDLVLLVDRMRRQLDQWGYGTDTIPNLFKLFSSDGSGELSITDFGVMLEEFKVRLTEERVVELFACFDRDKSGSIDEKEFLRVVFPRTWHKMVQEKKAEEEREKARKAEEERLRKERRRKGRALRRVGTAAVGSPKPLGEQQRPPSGQVQCESEPERRAGLQLAPAPRPTQEVLVIAQSNKGSETPLPNTWSSPSMSRQVSEDEVEVLTAGCHTPVVAEPSPPGLNKPVSWPKSALGSDPEHLPVHEL